MAKNFESCSPIGRAELKINSPGVIPLSQIWSNKGQSYEKKIDHVTELCQHLVHVILVVKTWQNGIKEWQKHSHVPDIYLQQSVK